MVSDSTSRLLMTVVFDLRPEAAFKTFQVSLISPLLSYLTKIRFLFDIYFKIDFISKLFIFKPIFWILVLSMFFFYGGRVKAFFV